MTALSHAKVPDGKTLGSRSGCQALIGVHLFILFGKLTGL
jgi:hypothetical protein